MNLYQEIILEHRNGHITMACVTRSIPKFTTSTQAVATA